MLLSWYVGETYHWRNGSQLSLFPFPMPSTFSSAKGKKVQQNIALMRERFRLIIDTFALPKAIVIIQ